MRVHMSRSGFFVVVKTKKPRTQEVSRNVSLGHYLSEELGTSFAVSERRLLDEPWRQEQESGREALTQAIGRLSFEGNWEGLLVPSAARKDGVNLIVFPANLDVPRSWVR